MCRKGINIVRAVQIARKELIQGVENEIPLVSHCVATILAKDGDFAKSLDHSK